MKHRVVLAGVAMLSVCLTAAQGAPTGPGSGASLAWTSTDAQVVQARQMVAEGRYSDAEALLKGADAAADPAARQARQELVELIRRAREDYTLDDAQLLAKLKEAIPDVTQADLDRWCAAGDATFKVIDGKRLFFGREPSNIFKLSAEAKSRRDQNAKQKDDTDARDAWTLQQHLKKVIEEAESTGKEFVTPVHHRIKYSISLTPSEAGGKAGSLLRVWLPYPQEYRQQRNVKLLSMSPKGGTIAPSAVDGSTMTGAPQRTVYFEKKVEDPAQKQVFAIEFEYDSYAYYPKLDDAKVQPLPADFDRSYLAERPPHIVFTPEIRKATAEAVGDATSPLEKVRRIYHYLNKTVRYAYEDEYCTIPSFAVKAITCKRGDCGIQSTLFITMCRCAGVPARWQSGWETKVIGWTMHDWAEFYVAPWGWLPGDQSYGVQKESDDPRVRDFYIGHQDAYRMIVNLDYGCPLQPPKNSLRSEPADFQRGEVEMDGKNLYFDKWDYHIEINRS